MIRSFSRSKFVAHALIISVAVLGYIAHGGDIAGAADEQVKLSFDASGGNPTGSATEVNGQWVMTCHATLQNLGTVTATNIKIAVSEQTDVMGSDPSVPPNVVHVSQPNLPAPPEHMYLQPSQPYFNFLRYWIIPSLAPGAAATITAQLSYPHDRFYQASFHIESADQVLFGLAGDGYGCSTPGQGPGGAPPGSGTPPPGSGFIIDCNPVTTSIVAGSPAAYDISLTTDAGFNSPVTVTAEGVPSPATYGISPRNILGGAFAKSAIARITNTQAVAPNIYTIHFVGTAGSNRQTVDCNLDVHSATHVLTTHVTGQGSVTVNPSGTPSLSNCTSNCSATYSDGQHVTITAASQNGALFTGWRDGPCSGTGTCSVVMSDDISVTANFNGGTGGGGSNFNLTGNVVGSGTLSANPAGNPSLTGCATSCIASFPPGQGVTVTPSPIGGSTFTGWSGACSGTANCSVTMNGDTNITATFSGGSGCVGAACGGDGGGGGTGGCVGAACGGGGGGAGCVGAACGGGGGGTPPAGTPVPPPTGVTTDNNTCEKILVKWTAPGAGIDGYNVYRSSSNGSWGTPLNAHPLASSPTEYLDATASAGSSYYYAVTSLRSGNESAKAVSIISPINVKACAPDLSTSDKDITRVNGVNNIIAGHLPIPCSNMTDPIKVVDTFHEGDVLRFAISICNTGVRDAKNLSFTDQLTNLSEPSTGWRATYNGVSVLPIVSGTIPNQVLTFEHLGDIPAPTAPDTVEFRVIVFEAQVTSPKPGTVGEYRFQNQGNIFMNGNPAKHIQTPSYLFSGGPAIPKRNEQQP